MRQFDYREKWKNLLTPEIVSYLTQIHEFKGEQTLFIEAKADTLTQLVEIAKIQKYGKFQQNRRYLYIRHQIAGIGKRQNKTKDKEMNRKLPDTEMY